MQLNRAVCFGYPEARIPWFQQNYIEAHISSGKCNVQMHFPISKSIIVSHIAVVPKNTKFHDDISKMLLSFVGDKSLIETDYITPYGYRVSYFHFPLNVVQ